MSTVMSGGIRAKMMSLLRINYHSLCALLLSQTEAFESPDKTA
jgi:hypothetical protein